MRDYKISPALAEESTTDGYFTSADGKKWPIYSKVLAIAALGNAGVVNVPHLVTGIKLDGHLHVRNLFASSGTGGVTARTILAGNAVAVGIDATNVVLTTTTNLSAQSGRIVIEYCKTADNV
jgi:hypothetical protein